jgi:hypothetical protein
MTEQSENPKPRPAHIRPEDSMTDVGQLRLELAKYRVIAFWGIPYEHHDYVTGDTAQSVEDSAHLLADMLNLIPTEN